jgi:hypothetical protein
VRRDGEDEPTSEEEAAALNGPRLGATVSLERAGIVDGICLLAKVTANFEALAIRTGESDKALIESLKEDKKNFDLSKKLLA